MTASPYTSEEIEKRRQLVAMVDGNRDEVVEWDRWLATVDDRDVEIERLREALRAGFEASWYPVNIHSNFDARDAEIVRLREALTAAGTMIRRVLKDEESRPGAWGPDVTCVADLKDALDKIESTLGGDRAEGGTE